MWRPRPLRLVRRCLSVLGSLTVIIATIAAGTPQPGLAWQDEPGSPGTDRAQVIAQGVAALPAGEAVWRTVRTRAAPLGTAEFMQQSLGFVVAMTGPILLTSRESGEQLLLGAGEAAFVPEGEIQQRASLSGQPATYLAVELVASDAPAPPADAIVLQPGQPFAVPAGLRDLDLLSGTLRAEETYPIADTGAKNVILITEGAANVGRADSEPVVLLAGEAATFSGQLLVTAAPGGDSSRVSFVAATIGQDVPVPPEPVNAAATAIPVQQQEPQPASPAATEGQGSIVLQVYACPPGMTAANLAAAACAPATGNFDVAIDSEQLAAPLTLADATRSGDAFVWDGLNPGEYLLVQPGLPSGAGSFVVSARNAESDADGGVSFRITAEEPDASLRIYFFFPE